ncbi:MAG: IS66 family transposase [Myxococcales bacterium]|nr:IS66 family transposase [Myxococcales bacterium]
MDVATLAARLDELHAQVQQLTAAHEAEVAARKAETQARLAAEARAEQYRKLYNEALERCRLLELGLVGRTAERLSGDDAQLTLSVLGTLLGEREAEAKPNRTVKEHERRKPTGRRPLPEDLPRVDIEVLPDEVQQQGLDAFEKIGEEVSEVVERRRASMVVVRIHRPKYVRKDRERCAETAVEIAAPPDLPIPRGLAGPGLLADTIVKRLADHLPLHRQEQIFARDGLPLARSTICGWHRELAELCRPLLDAMWREALGLAPYLCVDATGVLVQAKDKCRRSHFWVVIAPDLHVMFGFSAKHDNKAIDALLAGYHGYLVADAHSVYDHLFTDGTIIEVGCWSHCRRYFYKALSSEPERAREALALIGELFAIERKLNKASPDKRKAVRQQSSTPVLDAFFAWCTTHAQTAIDETPLAKALGYALNQRQALERFLEDGRLPIHNNRSERELRREAIGRKNWLFVGNDEAAEVNTTFVSLIASCQMHGIEPYGYLRDLLCLLPLWPRSRVLELAPAHWRKTLEQQDTQQRLAGNVFRQIALGELAPHGPEG